MSALRERVEFDEQEPDRRVVVLNPSMQVLLFREQNPVTRRITWKLPAAAFVEGLEEDQTIERQIEKATGLKLRNLKPSFFPGRDPEELVPNKPHPKYFSAQVVPSNNKPNIDWSLRFAWFGEGQLRSLNIDPETREAIRIVLSATPN